MRNKIIIIVLISAFKINAQVNLVMNPSFESYTICPTAEGLLPMVPFWSNCSGSADYFNSCATAPVGVPVNSFGYQVPFHGNAYCGFGTYANGVSNAREIPCVQLSLPLQVGIKYFLSFRVARAHNLNNAVIYSTNNFGVKLSINFLSGTNIIDNIAKFNYTGVITDTANWTLVKGSFISDSLYQFLMIGNFYDDANTTAVTQEIPQPGTVAYYYLDNVCLSTDSLLCSGDPVQSINENNLYDIKIYPNPSSNKIRIENIYGKMVSICDIYGQSYYFNNSKSLSDITLEVLNWPEGIYFIRINSVIKKIIINRKQNEN